MLKREMSTFLKHFEGIDELLEWYLNVHIAMENGILAVP